MDKVELKDIERQMQEKKVKLNTGLSENDRSAIATELGSVLADHYLLLLKTHNYHWNVKGQLFKSVHDITEDQYNEIFAAIDEIAERIRSIGFDAPGTFTEYSQMSKVKEGKKGLSAEEMIADLVQSHETLIKNLRETLEAAEKVKDEVTVDMMIERLDTHEKYAWMLRSFIEK